MAIVTNYSDCKDARTHRGSQGVNSDSGGTWGAWFPLPGPSASQKTFQKKTTRGATLKRVGWADESISFTEKKNF